MKRFVRIFAFALALLLCAALCACNSGASFDTPKNESSAGFDSANDGKGGTIAMPDKKIIRTANISAETKNYAADLATVRELVTSLGGYTEYSRESVSKNNNIRSFNATFRVPAEKLDAFLTSTGNTVHVLSSSVNAEDISASYYDVESRLATLRAEKTALDAMLAGATSQGELMALHERLFDVMEEIDATQAKLNVYQNDVAMSTVNFSLAEVFELTEAERYGTRLGNAFVEGWSAFGSFFAELSIFLVRALPFLLLFGGIGTGVFFLVRHQNRKRAAKWEQAQANKKELPPQ